MIKINEVISFLDSIAPQNWQEGYDNAGLITGNPDWPVQGILVCLDSTENIIDEAIHSGCNLIIAHHPIIFSGLKKITGAHYVEKVIIKAIKNDIAIFAIHTNLDNAFFYGVNTKFCEQIGLQEINILAPKKNETGNNLEAIGAGMYGWLPEPMPIKDFFNHLKSKMELQWIKHTEIIKPTVSKIALCGGSGSFLTKAAISVQADVFISSDFKYHEFFEANNQIIIVDIGHFESEKYTIDLLFGLLQNKFSTFAVRFTKHITNPVHYL